MCYKRAGHIDSIETPVTGQLTHTWLFIPFRTGYGKCRFIPHFFSHGGICPESQVNIYGAITKVYGVDNEPCYYITLTRRLWSILNIVII